jgi:hypothetical protein
VPGEFEELPRGEIFFTNLDPFDASGQVVSDAVEQ